MKLKELKYQDEFVLYRNKDEKVMIPETYKSKEKEVRACWVSSYINDFEIYSDQEKLKNSLLNVIETLKSYHMNTIIFHVRSTNDASYITDLAPLDTRFGTLEDYKNFDWLKWFIEECHKNNLEFHAWFNPYRIRATKLKGITKEEIASWYKDYPLNPASNPDNILKSYRGDGDEGAILNPGLECVRQYIIKVCLEVMEKYDVDAIHFDDYFYAQMSPTIDVLSEEDQNTYVDYIKNNKCDYKEDNAEDKKNWRRYNVNKFIYDLHVAIKEFNERNKRNVQLGISPTGIYRNGDGSVESGSNTMGQEHYASYLFCDSLKWVKNEWIDYIIPQTYWAFTHKVAGYADVVDWWNKAVEGTNVNLYTGMGLYMEENPNAYSWAKESLEAANQVIYNTKCENVMGLSIFAYKTIKMIEKDSNQIAYEGLLKLKELWNCDVNRPEVIADKYIK